MAMASEVLEESQSQQSAGGTGTTTGGQQQQPPAPPPAQQQQSQQTDGQTQQQPTQQSSPPAQISHPLQPPVRHQSGSVSSASQQGDNNEPQPSPCPGPPGGPDDIIEHSSHHHSQEQQDGVEGQGGDEQDHNRINQQLNGQQPTNGQTTNGTNGAQRSKCFCWCCCCNCSSLKSYNICTRTESERTASRRSASRRRQQSNNQGGGGGKDPLGPLEINSSNGGEGQGGKLGDSCGGSDPFHTDAPPPSLDTIRLWSESFERLMGCPWGRKVFADFLRREFSEENILFWLACEELKLETSDERIEERARNIYEDFISILSPSEVSLDSRVREIINKNMVEPNRETFEEAQVQIYTLMQRDSYPRFVNSPAYRKLAGLPTPSRKGSAA